MSIPEHIEPGEPTGLEIAIIGLAGRFPGASSIEQFWKNLCEGSEAITFFSDDMLADAGVDPDRLHDPAYIKAGAILDDIEGFDAAFFGYSPREASITDPQQRLFLECAWEALERAGYDSETYPGAIGLYAGSRMSNYLLSNLMSRQDIMESVGRYHIILGNDKDFLTTRVSYKLNLTGPSVSVSTACSTSLVAVHLACQGLISGACDIALAGGVSIALPQISGYRYQEDGILSPDGHCRAFDAQAQGTIGGNGLGVIVLKRLEDALADNDHIHAVIKGSAINNDGAGKVGYTAPSVAGQAQVIQAAHVVAEVDPAEISYIEAHGTGTALGDPVEVAALTKALQEHTERKQFCALGSVKTNIGHLDAAAGVAGLIKTALALEYKQIPPSLHFTQPNPHIDFANSPFYVNDKLTAWPANGKPRLAGVSSFGIGGTNAHIVLEEAPYQEPSRPSRPAQLLLLSAQTATALDTATANLAAYLKQHPDVALADVAYTLQLGRRAFPQRRMVVCHDSADAQSLLETMDEQRVLTQERVQKDRFVTFMFSGQGSQYLNMGYELYQTEPVFREEIDRCAELFKPHLGRDLRAVLYPASELDHAAAEQQLQQTELAQAALFTVEYALAQLLMAWGLKPQALIGHSIGEYVAACVAEVIALEDAVMLVATRGRLMQSLPGGTMLSVALAPEAIQPLLGATLSIAAINAPNRCVVSGPAGQIEALEQQLAAQGIKGRRLHTSHAFHSPMMEPIMASFAECVRQITLRPPAIPFISNLTGTWISDSEATDPWYWAKHLRQAVRFADGLQALAEQPKGVLLEIGPGTTLTMLARQQLPQEQIALAALRHAQDDQSDVAFLLQTLGQLWLVGLPIDWTAFYAHEQRRRLPLPTYPFERKPYWIEPARVQSSRAEPSPISLVPTSDNADTPAELISAASPDLVTVEMVDADDGIEHIVSKQLEVMQQQLAYLATTL